MPYHLTGSGIPFLVGTGGPACLDLERSTLWPSVGDEVDVGVRVPAMHEADVRAS
jgi:hypothetical protein